MRYVVKPSINEDLIERIFENRGIDSEKMEFLYPGAENIKDGTQYKNMKLAVETVLNHTRNQSTILIVVDSDADGYCSNAMLRDYLSNWCSGLNINFIIHSTKAHGITDEVIEEVYKIKANLVLMADAGSNDYEQHKLLNDMGVDVVILDHHECEKYSDYAIVVNNQLDPIGNKSLSGGGMVMKFLEVMDSYIGCGENAEYYSDLCAVAMVSDSMLIKDLETRFYVMKGIHNINNPLLKELLKSKEEIAISDISYSIAPVINAIIRVAEQEEKEYLFRALCGEEIDMVLNMRGKGDVPMDLPTYITKIADRAKRLQTKLVSEVSNSEEFKLIHEGLPFAIGITPQEFNNNLTGLLANKIADNLQKPCLILKNKEEILKGSARSTKDINNFRDYLMTSNLFNYCEGHQGAFGVSIDKNNLETLKQQYRNTTVETTESSIMVEKAYDSSSITPFDILQVGDMSKFWSKGFEKPLFYIKLNCIPKSAVSIIGKNNDTIKITYKSISFIKFKCEPTEVEHIKNLKNLNVELIGEFAVNKWMGRTSPQVIIKDLEVSETFSTGSHNHFI
ncbi:MAG: DHH family phosphoesterase [Bacilli bacterium]